MRYPFRPRNKAGFTLIELLVVIAILAILFSLVTAGVMKYMDNIPVTQTVNDIRQLTVAIESFKSKYGIYPPSFIVLGNSAQYTTYVTTAANPALAQQQVNNSIAYLSGIWPRTNFTNYNWGVPGNTAIALEGDQCLVFFLNGPGGVNANGWSTIPTDPANTTGKRVGPFFEFPVNRLLPRTGNPLFPSFYDPYTILSIPKGKPYAYFCSGRSAGGYGGVSGLSSDCPTLYWGNTTNAVVPYFQTNSNTGAFLRYYNNNSFQIISAGKDRNFGPGGAWTPTAANGGNVAAYNPGGAGVDDYSNFSGDLLGVF